MLSNCIIGIDWGTTYLRAYLCEIDSSSKSKLLAKKTDRGVSKKILSFEETLFNCIEPWLALYGKIPIILSGQIGSSIGWHEAAYLPCPINPNEIRSELFSFVARGYNISIVPGISCQIDSEYYDVMRGEELQILGWLQLNPKHAKGRYLLCLPGTHTKWVLLNDGKIQLFKTAMTGELFDLLSNQSILIQKQNTPFNKYVFLSGATKTLNSELDEFSHSLFSVRSMQLFSQLEKTDAQSYLSGFLIGSDVRAALNAKQWNISDFDSIEVVGAPHLSDCFSHALAIKGIECTVYDVEKVTLLGFVSLFVNQSNADCIKY